MNEDQLQALFGAVGTVFPPEEFIQKRHAYFLPASL
jgi:hypothetical protein